MRLGITGNLAQYGGGLYLAGTAVLSDSRITSNRAGSVRPSIQIVRGRP